MVRRPGTGKTHTIHYLASQLPDHTTLLVTAEQVALLDHYFQLARFLQLAMIVVEDVDLIARRREETCQQALITRTVPLIEAPLVKTLESALFCP